MSESEEMIKFQDHLSKCPECSKRIQKLAFDVYNTCELKDND